MLIIFRLFYKVIISWIRAAYLFIDKISSTRLRAFSLLEIAFVLIIMGMVSLYTIPTFIHTRTVAKIRETDEKLEALTYALAGYVLIHQHLPSPANPAAPDADSGSDDLMTGIIPYRKLGIQAKDAKDGYKNWISYSVSPGLRQPARPPTLMSAMGSDGFCQIPASIMALSVHNEKGQSLLRHTNDDMIAFVLISHGKHGDGAFDHKGQRRPVHSPLKEKNSDGNAVFIDAPLTQEFDDRVRWVTRNNLMAIYAKRPCVR